LIVFTDHLAPGAYQYSAIKRPLSLLYASIFADINRPAGSNTTAIANPIDDVLTSFGVSMVGSSPSASLMGKILGWAKKLLTVAESQAANAQLPPQASQAAVDAVRRVKERHEGRLLSIPGVIGAGVGVSEKAIGQAAIEVYAIQATESLNQALPRSLDGVEVRMVETGEIHAY